MKIRANLRLLVFAGLMVVAAALLNGRAVPIYDGIGQPDEPYRYVTPPASQTKKTPPPTIAESDFTPYEMSSGVISTYFTSSKENGPQFLIGLSRNSLIIPKGTKSIKVKAEPLAPSGEPLGGKIAGNVYRLSITGDAGPVALNPSDSGNYKYVDMRLPQGFPPNPVVEYRASGLDAWQKLPTNRTGNDIYEAQIHHVGDFALVTLDKAGSAGSSGGDSSKSAAKIIPLIVAVFVMAGIILAIRFSGSRKPERK